MAKMRPSRLPCPPLFIGLPNTDQEVALTNITARNLGVLADSSDNKSANCNAKHT